MGLTVPIGLFHRFPILFNNIILPVLCQINAKTSPVAVVLLLSLSQFPRKETSKASIHTFNTIKTCIITNNLAITAFRGTCCMNCIPWHNIKLTSYPMCFEDNLDIHINECQIRKAQKAFTCQYSIFKPCIFFDNIENLIPR